MKCSKRVAASWLAAALLTGCSRTEEAAAPAAAPAATPAPPPVAAHSHGAGPNGGVVFDLGSHHAEFTVDHGKQQVTVLVLGGDEKTPNPVTATEFVLTTNAARTGGGTVVAPMTIALVPQDVAGGKAATFVGTDPGIGNVADFAGTVFGEIDGKPASGEFNEAEGASRSDAHTPHDGVLAKLRDSAGADVGFVELKLHDDKGDLEAWLGKDREMSAPLDVPAGTTVTVTFLDMPGKTAVLAVRDNDRNEDEDGNANLRDGNTNYFVFPGSSGQDSTWLMGQAFRSAVKLAFDADRKSYSSEEFVLVPHTHGDGGGHTH